MNSVSPLFAVHAEELIHLGNPSEAIELCLNGINVYSDYPIAYAVAAKGYIATENQIEAIKILEKGLLIFPLHKTLQRLYNDILNPAKQDLSDENNSNQFDTIISDSEIIVSESDIPTTKKIISNKHEKQFSPLRIIETVKVPENFIGSIKASSVNIISGLEFATLKIANGSSYQTNSLTLFEPPPFPTFLRKPKQTEESRDYKVKNQNIELQSNTKLTPLEELAARLEKVRIPVAYQEIARSNNPSQVVPEMITETMARIYEKQGAYSEAIKAYQILARRMPEKLEFYEKKINEIVEIIVQEQNENNQIKSIDEN